MRRRWGGSPESRSNRKEAFFLGDAVPKPMGFTALPPEWLAPLGNEIRDASMKPALASCENEADEGQAAEARRSRLQTPLCRLRSRPVVAAHRKRHRRFGEEPRPNRARRSKLHSRILVQGHREGAEGADPSKTQRGVAEYINALLLWRLAPPRHSGRWVGARVASLRCPILRPGEVSINRVARQLTTRFEKPLPKVSPVR